MTDTPDSPADTTAAAPKKRSGGLNAMLLADLKAMAAGMGIAGSGSMKKAQIVEAIKAAQAGGPASSPPKARASRTTARTEQPAPEESPAQESTAGRGAAAPTTDQQDTTRGDEKVVRRRTRSAAVTTGQDPQRASGGETEVAASDDQAPIEASRPSRRQGSGPQAGTAQAAREQPGRGQAAQGQARQGQAPQGQAARGQEAQPSQAPKNQSAKDQAPNGQASNGQGPKNQAPNNQASNNQGQQGDPNDQNDQSDEDGRGGRNRRRRGRDRTRTGPVAGQPTSSQRTEPDTTVLEDDVLVPAAGILDVLDNYAFVRTSGYLPGADDVYLSLSMVRKFGLRRGDAVVGQVRQPREGERKEKFNPMVRIDTVNGADPQQATSRPDFDTLTPTNASERLRMETDSADLTGRTIDIVAPIGKGQRGLIASAPKAGKTMVLKAIARSVTANNPECHLMVVLVDQRPEEVTDFERSVKGEVIASTFDHPAGDHTIVAELATERAKRLVELGHDVVVLLDGITSLGRAYNQTVAASGRALSGGVDTAALHAPKRIFGAARNIEKGGSLTIIATALIESSSRTDEVIFDEFKGTDNMQLRLRSDCADRRVFPAIDPVESGTRREDLLMGEQELAIVWKLRRDLASLGGARGTQALLDRLTSTHSNIEFLTQIQKSSPNPKGVG